MSANAIAKLIADLDLIGITLKSVDSERSLDLASLSLAKHVRPARAAVTRRPIAITGVCFYLRIDQPLHEV